MDSYQVLTHSCKELSSKVGCVLGTIKNDFANFLNVCRGVLDFDLTNTYYYSHCQVFSNALLLGSSICSGATGRGAQSFNSNGPISFQRK